MNYYYADADRKPVGPYTFTELKELQYSGRLHAESFVIEEGGSRWHQLGSLGDAEPVRVGPQTPAPLAPFPTVPDSLSAVYAPPTAPETPGRPVPAAWNPLGSGHHPVGYDGLPPRPTALETVRGLSLVQAALQGAVAVGWIWGVITPSPVLGRFLFFVIAFVPIVLNVTAALASAYQARQLSPARRLLSTPSKWIPSYEIFAGVLSCNIVTMVIGILNLVLLCDRTVGDYQARLEALRTQDRLV